jgi:hypothetical protein
MDDFKGFKNVSKFLWNPRLFQKYPDFLASIFRKMLNANGPKKKMRVHLQDAMKEHKIGRGDLLRDGLNGGMNL